ncbi:MAG: zinc dependent phospholipase C family protein [Chloroflexi bacterium]|nr:zinc dependent phospholipase C family protein [Chloroflexota bacterium]
MPNLIAHMDIALESARCLAGDVGPQPLRDTIQKHLGSFLLGSCAPDIRAITKDRRDATHFAPVSNTVVGTGARNLFQAYPRLRAAASSSDPTVAFMAGYVSHLVADEAWIIDIYRPYFANRQQFPDPVVANVMDRALQLDLDRQALGLHQGADAFLGPLAEADNDVSVDFIPPSALAQWKERVAWVLQRSFSWERLLFLTRRQYPQDDGTAQRVASEFLATLPEGLEHVYQQVPRERVEAYRSTAIQEWVKAATRYLA